MRGIPRGSVILTVQARGHAPDLKWVNPVRRCRRSNSGSGRRTRSAAGSWTPTISPSPAHRSSPKHGACTIRSAGAPGPTPTDDSAGTTHRPTRSFSTWVPWASLRSDTGRPTRRARRNHRDAAAFTRPRTRHRRRDRTADQGVHPGAGLHRGEPRHRPVGERPGQGHLGPLLRCEPEHGGPAPGHPDRGRRLLARHLADAEGRRGGGRGAASSLRRGPLISCVARRPDGSPLAGAEVTLATVERPARVRDGRFQTEVGNQRIVKTRADGRFTLEPSEPPYTMLVLHDFGCAWLTVEDRTAVPPAALTVQPWSRMEGVLRIGRGAGESQTLILSAPSTPAGSRASSGPASQRAKRKDDSCSSAWRRAR